MSEFIYNKIVSGSMDLMNEMASLTPSSPIILYEIDLSQISQNRIEFDNPTDQPTEKGIFRVYNDYNIYNTLNHPDGTIKWKNNLYYPFPIFAEGFEFTSVGTLPTPKVIVSTASPDKSYNSFYKYIRMQIESLGDILGAKFTRIRTFLKYLDPTNFKDNINPFNSNPTLYEVELPRDIYYIDRKTSETKNSIEYELNTILDLENITLPGRTIYSKKCPFQYRGESCCYEFDSRLTYLHSGIYAGVENPPISVKGLQTAPPVANENNELYIGKIFSTGDIAGRSAILRITGGLGNSGLWQENANYTSGDYVFLESKGLKYYFVCINKHTSDYFNSPPKTSYWSSDSCEKSITSCRLRWLKNPAFRPVIWPINRNGESFIKTFRRFETLYNDEEKSRWLTGINGVPINFPRRPGAENPQSPMAHGIPKDANGNYLNGFLPFGGFPGTNTPNI
jgi:lambda family phage minor tail protein L